MPGLLPQSAGVSNWRRKAIEALPEEKEFFEQPDTTPYQVFFELLPATIKAHRQNNTERLKKYYQFAEWCFRQTQQELWNAAGVAFYEHLADHEVTFAAMPVWIGPTLYAEIRELLRVRLDGKKMELLDEWYGYNKKK
ncbi:hypothetical protein SAMN05421823_102236 [Catalinimonas alkaloidigena]|uniref:DUF7674 domain-containing protein n=1 Tax=Catalinimonas alkaloidigena TaxID=1075417 RepID=A0A1G9AB42_9BACT|nr:hypothetical protein [Catalinimonas alkaloidigena]SDK24566.1 hypothetical protein SAMN05421823_102236 [Catalinimonas alkaloidigena]